MSSGCGQKASTILTTEQQQLVFRHQAAVAELLRHFWSCFPARTTQLEVKVCKVSSKHTLQLWRTERLSNKVPYPPQAHKMHQCLMDYSAKQLQELQHALDSSDSLRLVQHLHECISRASQHYRKWAAKKKTPHKLLGQ